MSQEQHLEINQRLVGVLITVMGGRVNRVGGVLEIEGISKVGGASYFEVTEDGEKCYLNKEIRNTG